MNTALAVLVLALAFVSTAGAARDYGVRLDIGAYWGLAAGRFGFDTDADGAFRPRHASTWYAKTFFYLGATWGQSAGGNIGFLARDAWAGFRGLFHRTRKEQFIED